MGGEAWRTVLVTAMKAASSAMRCGLGSVMMYSASGRRTKSSRRRAENWTHDVVAEETRAAEQECRKRKRVATGHRVSDQCGEELVAEDEGTSREEDLECDEELECHGGIPLPRVPRFT